MIDMLLLKLFQPSPPSSFHLHPRSPLRSEQMDRTFTGREKLLSLGLPVWGPYAKEAGVDGGSVYDANTKQLM